MAAGSAADAVPLTYNVQDDRLGARTGAASRRGAQRLAHDAQSSGSKTRRWDGQDIGNTAHLYHRNLRRDRTCGAQVVSAHSMSHRVYHWPMAWSINCRSTATTACNTRRAFAAISTSGTGHMPCRQLVLGCPSPAGGDLKRSVAGSAAVKNSHTASASSPARCWHRLRASAWTRSGW